MISKLTTLLIGIFCCFTAAGAAELQASLLYSLHFGEKSAPTDVVIEKNGSVGVYDAFHGSYTVYRGTRAAGTVQNALLKGGNCLVKNGNYYIYCNSRAKTLDMLTQGMSRYASFGSGLKGGYDPSDAVVSGGSIYSVDNDNHRIIRTDIASKRVTGHVGGYGDEKLHFWYPYGIAIDKKGVLYISEVLNTRIQKITKNFQFYEFLGGWGIDSGEFYRPTGVALLPNGALLVGDGYTGILQYFNADGHFGGIVKDASGRKLKFDSVTHIRINGRTLAVVDAFDKSVYVYELKGSK